MDTITSDRELLQRYVDARNAEAFAELARRYSGLVFNTAKRVTGCAADAEDVVQECFLDLARQAAEVRSVLPAWLHCVATRRALNLRSSAIARRNRETSVQPDVISPTVSGEWSELAPLLDQAIVQLPEELRAPLLLAFMDGLNHDDIALRLVCSRATVGRRIDEAITRLRRRLERSHGGAMSVSLPAMLLAIPHDPAPVAAVHGAVCIGLAGYGPAAAKAPWFRFVAIASIACIGSLATLLYHGTAPQPVAAEASVPLVGLQASLFSNTDLAGTPLRRIDPSIDFGWAGNPPADGMSGEQFSIRWSGLLTVPRSGTYTLTITSDDGVWLMLDGAVLIDAWHGQYAAEHTTSVTLDASRPHEFVLDYFQSLLNASVHLEWTGPGIPRQIVPATAFQPIDLPMERAVHRLGLPGAWRRIPIGLLPPGGSVHADSKGQEFSLASTGGMLDGIADRCQFAAQEIGDEVLSTRVTWMYSPRRPVFAGLMLRASADPDAAMLACGVAPGDGLVVLVRRSAGAAVERLVCVPGESSPWLRISRRSDRCIAAVSDDGKVWRELATQILPLHGTALLGMTLAGGDTSAGAGAVFHNALGDAAPAETAPTGNF